MRLSLGSLLISTILWCTTQAAAPQDSAGTPLFRTGVDLVELTVTVTNAARTYVSGLTADDFSVSEDGVPQRISLFASEDVPMDVAILLDTSSSMRKTMPTAREAAVGLVGTLGREDRATIIGVNERMTVLSPLTGDMSSAVGGLERASAQGTTALYNALYIALREVARGRDDQQTTRRQAIVVLSDGRDTTSLIGYDEVLALARSSAIAIYTVTLPSAPVVGPNGTIDLYGPKARFVMRTFADETGGQAFVAADVTELATIYTTIAEELSHQYTLGYVSSNAARDGLYRTLRVTLREHPGLTARHRTGYQAPKAYRTLSRR